MVCWCSVAAETPAKSDPTEHQDACHPAELFATDNTAVITDPKMDSTGQLQDGLGLFEIQADVTIAQNGAAVTGSTLLDGVHWSNALQQTTYERSREFHLCRPDELTLHTLAEALRRQFNQEAVLTFTTCRRMRQERMRSPSPYPTSTSHASAMRSWPIQPHTTDCRADLSPQPTTP